MNKRVLGRTGIEVAEVSFGCVEIGLPYGIGVKDEADMLSDADAIELLRSAVDRGMNFFDTAPGYGKSETILGKAFADRRDRVVICTKCSSLFDDDGKLLTGQALADCIDNSIQGSLKALQTDYLDVYLMHRVSDELIESKEVAEIFAEYKRKGVLRSVGLSTYGYDQTRKAIENDNWDVVQLAYNLMEQVNGELIDLAQQRGVGIMVRSVLFKGILTDRGRELHEQLKPLSDQRAKYLELLNDETPSLSDLATKFVLSNPSVSSVLIGIDRMEYLDKALEIAEQGPLGEATMARCLELPFPNPEFIDLPKWDREGWL